MSIFTSRTALYFIVVSVFIAASLFELDRIWIIYGLLALAWLFFTGLANDIVERISGTTEKDNVHHRNKYKLVSFNDAVAEELMRIRSDLVSIKVKQDKLGWDMPDDFLRMYWMYQKYSSSYLCAAYKTPDNTWGKIILILDNAINLDDYWQVKFDAEGLRKINSPKTSQIASGMNLSVYVCESKDDIDSTSERHAKILFVEEDSYGERIFVTLEINLDTIWDDLDWRPDENIGKYKIIRKIEIHSAHLSKNYCNFILDKNLKK